MSKRIIISISSDIGHALALDWLAAGHEVIGTYRTASDKTKELTDKGVKLVRCDLSDKASVKEAISGLKDVCDNWESMVIAPGLQDPIGLFLECDFDEWEESVSVNYMTQMRILHTLMPLRDRNVNLGPSVLMFAGGGTNNAVPYYSAYTIAKIASIKMCELLDAEVPDTRFAIIGPGWVKTKIHDATLKAKETSRENYVRTKEKLTSDECVPMEKVVECCNWVVNTPREVTGGRNFSLVFDCWGTKEIEEVINNDDNMYKLRRWGNDKLVRSEPISEKTVRK